MASMQSMFPMGGIGGTPVYSSEAAVRTEWHFPERRFVEYGPEDEWWARKYGYGHAGPPIPCAYRMKERRGFVFVVHPSLLDRLRVEMLPAVPFTG